jgi:hypothetical protein
MKQLKLALLLAIVFSAGSLLGYFNVSFNDTILPNATRNLILAEDPNYPLDPGLANRWACQLYGTGPDEQIDPIGLLGEVTDDDFVILPAIHQNASFGLWFSSTGRWQPSGIRFFTNLEISGGTISQAPTGSKVYLRIYNNPVITEATKYFQFLIPYVIPSSGATVPVIPGGYGWTPWADVPGHGPSNTYQLSVSAMPDGIHEILKGGVATGNNTPWTSEALASSDSLVGVYSLTAGTGYYWEPASIEVTAEDFTARTAYTKAISFTKVLEPGNYELTVTSTPPGAAIWKDGVNTNFLTPHVFSPGAAGTYSVQMPGYTWDPAELVVPTLTQNTTIDFVGTLNQLSITANYMARVSKNGTPIEPPVYTSGTEVPVYVSDPGTYTVEKANTTWTPQSYVFDALSSQSVRFVGITTPDAVTNPIPADNHVYHIVYNAPQTAVYTLSWGAVTDVTGYKVYFGTDPATPEMLANVTTGTSVDTPAIGEGAYTWRVVPYVLDPAKGIVRNLEPLKAVNLSNTRGDGPAVDWHFSIVRLSALSITSNYVAEVYLNGAPLVPELFTTGTDVPVVVYVAGTYSVVRPNTTWIPATFVFNSPTAQAVRFVGSTIPAAATNPIPSDSHIFQIPFTAPLTAVYPLSWSEVAGVNGYKVYFGTDPATPTMLGDVTIGTTINTPEIGVGAYTWRVVPYIIDPARGIAREMAPIKAAVTRLDSRGDGPAVDWHFTIVRLPEVHTYTYNLQVNGPAGYTVTGPVNGTTPYLASDNDGIQPNTLLGSYTIAAAPANFHWVVNPIVVQASDFVLARTDYVYNATITFALEADIPVATPTFTPIAGTYTTAQSVTIACTTAGAQIRYTTDGTEPTATSTLYSAAINVATTTTIKAKGYKTGWLPSETATAAYVITGTVATPTFAPVAGTYTTAQNVTLACTTAGAQIRYTTDGTEPTATSTLYSAAINVAVTTTIKAKGFKTDWTPSATATAAYVITGTVATPTFTPLPGNYQNQVDVSIECVTAGASIRYTLDGTEPISTSPLYTQPINLTQTTTIKAKGFKTDWATSETATGIYNVAVANPEGPNTPVVTGISNVYPNPFSGSTTIKLGVKEANQAYQLKIYNIKGECVYRNSGNAKGSFDLKWNGQSDSGEKLPSGIYLISFTSGNTTQTRKAIIR